MLKRTPLFDAHAAAKARIVDFAGWEMPVEYDGVIKEHLAVRSACGLFDVSHMGEVEVEGPGALAALLYLTTNDLRKTADNQCQYTLLCKDDGGTVDDCIVYRFSGERFLVCVNASNTQKAFDWMSERAKEAGFDAIVRDVSASYAQLALQGPLSKDVLAPLVDAPIDALRTYRFIEARVLGKKAIVSRTGYTGEDGFEIYVEPSFAKELWDNLLDAGKSSGIMPIGLGARDTLRLEAGLPLYGHELDDATGPIEAGLSRFVSFDKGDFIGRAALERQATSGAKKTLIGLELTGPGIPRQGYEIRSGNVIVGAVTSGTMSPLTKKGIGMAYVKGEFVDSDLEVLIRGRGVTAKRVALPFYRKKARVA